MDLIANLMVAVQGLELDDRKSTSGYCLFLDSNLVSSTFKKQNTVSQSSTEAKYKSLASVTTKVTWLSSLLAEIC